MAVAAPELLSTDPGFAPDATEAIPPELPDAITETGDSAPFDVDSGEVLADQPEDAPPDDPLLAEQRAAWEAEYRPQIEAELSARFNENFRKFQSAKDQEVAQAQQLLRQAMAREQVRQDWMQRYFTDNGLDPRDIAVLENHLRRAEDEVRNTTQSTQNVAQGIVQYIDQRFHQRQAERQQQGQPQLNPNDPEVAQWRQWMAQTAAHYGPAADRALNSPAASQQDVQALMALQEAGRKMDDFERRKLTQLVQQQTAAQQAKTAAAQKAARERQAQRGPQSTNSRSGGGGKMDVATAVAKAWELHPADEAARRKFVTDNS